MVIISIAHKEGTLPGGAKVLGRSRSVSVTEWGGACLERGGPSSAPLVGVRRSCVGREGLVIKVYQTWGGFSSHCRTQAAVSGCPSWPVFI